jgi:hypothetical protein
VRDGNVTVVVTASAVGAAMRARRTVLVADALPMIDSISPEIVPLAGGNVTISGSHLDEWVNVTLGTRPMGLFRVSPLAGDITLSRRATAATTRGTVLLALGPGSLPNTPGYLQVTIVNIFARTAASDDGRTLFASERCRDGELGFGKVRVED